MISGFPVACAFSLETVVASALDAEGAETRRTQRTSGVHPPGERSRLPGVPRRRRFLPAILAADATGAMVRLLAALCLCAATALAHALPRNAPVPGGVAVVELGAAGAALPQVFFADRPQPVLRHNGRWVALVGLPLDTAAGMHRLRVTTEQDAYELPLAVREKHYPTQHLRIPDEHMVTPPPEVEARIALEQQRIAEWKRHYSPAPEPDTRFVLPAAGPRSARFGVRRVLNGEVRAPHAGLDVAVGIGAPLRAPAAGTVLAVADLYFTGRTVVIDHGRGVLTLYAHLSRVDVDEGQALARGETFGASGVSGRITGPHLHWVVLLGGSAVDPELFLPPAGGGNAK